MKLLNLLQLDVPFVIGHKRSVVALVGIGGSLLPEDALKIDLEIRSFIYVATAEKFLDRNSAVGQSIE